MRSAPHLVNFTRLLGCNPMAAGGSQSTRDSQLSRRPEWWLHRIAPQKLNNHLGTTASSLRRPRLPRGSRPPACPEQGGPEKAAGAPRGPLPPPPDPYFLSP